MKNKTCDECGDKKKLPFYSDPRDPPIEEGECLCADCYEGALVEVIDDMESDLEAYREDLEKFKKK